MERKVFSVKDASINSRIDKLTPPIYPNTITVEHDGEKYLWKTIKPEY
jgi:hypothetical protein